MTHASSTLVSDWFGPRFDALHPLLQALHRDGGLLHGEVQVETGRGIAGWSGRTLARGLGIPITSGRCGFEVDIEHTTRALHWRRRFACGDGRVAEVESVFVPVGRWPSGYWVETTGPVRLQLGVEVVDGGWHWRASRASVRGVRIPMWLLPRTSAGKAIVDGRYVFHVDITLPLLGRVLGYRGTLDALPRR